MKKIITALLIVAMLSTMVLTAFADVDIVYTYTDKGDESYGWPFDDVENIKSNANSTDNKLTEGAWFYDEDYGLFTNNSGWVDTITVAEKGGLKENNGDVTTNKGEIKTNTVDGYVKTNEGDIGVNNGKVDTNKGDIEVNNGTIKNNKGDVTTNTIDGTVTTTVILNDKNSVKNPNYDDELDTVRFGNTVKIDYTDDVVVTVGKNNIAEVTENYGTYEVVIESTKGHTTTIDFYGVDYQDDDGESVKLDQAIRKHNEEAAQYAVMTEEDARTLYNVGADYRLVNFTDKKTGETYTVGMTNDVKNPLQLIAIWELIQKQMSIIMDESMTCKTYSNAAVLNLRVKLYTDAELAAREITMKYNGEVIDSADWTVACEDSGAMVFTFSDAFMAKLPAGVNTVNVHLLNGMSFVVYVIK